MAFASTSRATSTRVSTIPRVSSPLASQSTTASQSSSEGEESDDQDSQDEDIESDIDDDDDDLEQLLQAAKSNARARAAGTNLDLAVADQTGLEDVNLADMDDSNNRLAAIFTQPAIASQVFDLAPSSNKGKARQVTTHPDDLPILSGVTDKWGEMPQAKLTKSSKRASKQASDVSKGWFDMPRRTLESLSNEEKREIQALRLSNAMDPKRFMRGQSKRDNKKMPEYFQMGHIVDDSASKGPRAGMEAPSSKPKRSTFMAGLLDDDKGRAYVNRKYAEVQAKSASGGRGYAKKRAKDRKGTFGQRGGSGGKKTRR